MEGVLWEEVAEGVLAVVVVEVGTMDVVVDVAADIPEVTEMDMDRVITEVRQAILFENSSHERQVQKHDKRRTNFFAATQKRWVRDTQIEDCRFQHEIINNM